MIIVYLKWQTSRLSLCPHPRRPLVLPTHRQVRPWVVLFGCGSQLPLDSVHCSFQTSWGPDLHVCCRLHLQWHFVVWILGDFRFYIASPASFGAQPFHSFDGGTGGSLSLCPCPWSPAFRYQSLALWLPTSSRFNSQQIFLKGDYTYKHTPVLHAPSSSVSWSAVDFSLPLWLSFLDCPGFSKYLGRKWLFDDPVDSSLHMPTNMDINNSGFPPFLSFDSLWPDSANALRQENNWQS